MPMHPTFRLLSAAAVIWLLFMSGWARGDDVTARIDRNVMYEGETLQLTISVPGQDDPGRPDLTPLEQDFDVLSTSQSSHVSIINGRASSRREWRLVLAPNRTGKLQIPTLAVGSASTQPLAVTVKAAQAASASGDAPKVMVETEVDLHAPFVQQEVIYTVRLLYRVALRDGNLTPPEPDNTVVVKLGEDTTYQTQRHGERYRVVERRYALFPQRSGNLEIPAVVFNGKVPDERLRQRDIIDDFFARRQGSMGDPFDDMLRPSRPVRVSGNRVQLDVRPQPALANDEHWLPAHTLVLAEQWSPDPPVFRVGEPVTRTVRLRAEGLSATQLPEFTLPDSPGINAYPDQGTEQDLTDGQTLTGVREQKWALVPTRTGDFTLPAMDVTWWDVDSGQARTATLPARVITVQPAAAGQRASGTQPSARQDNLHNPEAIATPPMDGEHASSGGSSTQNGGFTWAAVAALLFLMWLVTAVLWWRERRRQRPAHSSARGEARNGSVSTRQVAAAWQSGDPRQARDALLAWARQHWSGAAPTTLEQIAHRLPQDAATALRQLDQALYAQHGGKWQPPPWHTLRAGLTAAAEKPDRTQQASPLRPLYPRHEAS